MKLSLSSRCVPRFVLIGLAAAACVGVTGSRGAHAREKAVEVTASAWEIRQSGTTVTLATFDRSTPVQTTLTQDTRLEGVCMHCDIALQCRAAELAKRCEVCPCGRSNILCFTGKSSNTTDWQTLLLALPRGTKLRIEYADPERPKDGIKRLLVDRHGALFAVDGIASATPEQLQALGKAVGATKVERNAAGDRLQISLKSNWTVDKVTKMEKALAGMGGRLAFPREEAAAATQSAAGEH